jgi:hypothetical protein
MLTSFTQQYVSHLVVLDFFLDESPASRPQQVVDSCMVVQLAAMRVRLHRSACPDTHLWALGCVDWNERTKLRACAQSWGCKAVQEQHARKQRYVELSLHPASASRVQKCCLLNQKTPCWTLTNSSASKL